MLQQKDVALQAMEAVLTAAPEGARIFNFSIDYLCQSTDTAILDVKVAVRHQGRKTLVADIDVLDGSRPVAKALCTMLL